MVDTIKHIRRLMVVMVVMVVSVVAAPVVSFGSSLPTSVASVVSVEAGGSTHLNGVSRTLDPAVRGPMTHGVPPAAPTPPAMPPASPSMGSLPGCPPVGRAAVADKAAQRWWFCDDGAPVSDRLAMTTASAGYGLPPVGTHRIFGKDLRASGAHGETLHRFIAFYRTPRGNRIAFHEVVNQHPATVGDLDQRGASAGCFRIRRSDSITAWEFLRVGDTVVVLTN